MQIYLEKQALTSSQIHLWSMSKRGFIKSKRILKEKHCVLIIPMLLNINYNVDFYLLERKSAAQCSENRHRYCNTFYILLTRK